MITAQRRPSKHPAALISTKPAGQGPDAGAARDFVYFWPIYTGTSIPDGSWRDRMWLDTWV
ncbi:hypothetical protein ABZ516_13505 [Streptomyces sp. NPDC019826]|uniref:hypothetical protein n=1 Tax=Streptomyces sp. NPDC019826 TaxID=3156667 RepID=UPI0033C0378F